MSKWKDFTDKIERAGNKWADSWKDPQAADKSVVASAVGIIAPSGIPEHPGWRKEVRQNIENRKIDREPNPFKNQLSDYLKNVKTPKREIGKERER